MSKLYDIAQRYCDEYGASMNSIGKRMGSTGQTIQNWRGRGVRALPEQATLQRFADATKTPYGVVLIAALIDAGYVSQDPPRTLPGELNEALAAFHEVMDEPVDNETTQGETA